MYSPLLVSDNVYTASTGTDCLLLNELLSFHINEKGWCSPAWGKSNGRSPAHLLRTEYLRWATAIASLVHGVVGAIQYSGPCMCLRELS
jgi:hypothetical protein